MRVTWESMRGGGCISFNRTINVIVSKQRSTGKFYVSWAGLATDWLPKKLSGKLHDTLNSAREEAEELLQHEKLRKRSRVYV